MEYTVIRLLLLASGIQAAAHANLVLVVLQVSLVFPSVTSKNDENSEVNQRLTGGVVTVKVSSLVLAPWSGWLLGSRSWTGWQLLVEGNHLGHSLGVRVGANVLNVSNENTTDMSFSTN